MFEISYRNVRLSRHTNKLLRAPAWIFPLLRPHSAWAALGSIITMEAAAEEKLFLCILEVPREGTGWELMHRGLCKPLCISEGRCMSALPPCVFLQASSIASQGWKPCEAADHAPRSSLGSEGQRAQSGTKYSSSPPQTSISLPIHPPTQAAYGSPLARLPRNHPAAFLSSYAKTDAQDLGFDFTASLEAALSHDALTSMTVGGLRKSSGTK